MKKLLVVVAIIVVVALALNFQLFGDGEHSRDAKPTAQVVEPSTPVAGSPRENRDGLGNTSAPGKAPAFPPGAHLRKAHVTEFVPLPDGPVKDFLADLSQQANRSPPSAQAAFHLYVALNGCREMAAWSPQELAVERARRGTDPKLQIPDCTGVAREDFAQADRWLKIAAELGHEGAQVQYAQRYAQSFGDLQAVLKNPQEAVAYREQAARYLLSASSAGNWDAMWALSRSYEQGTLTDPNPQLAYAYRYAIQRTGGLPITIAGAVGALQRQMTADELRSAQQLGDQIVASCCVLDK